MLIIPGLYYLFGKLSDGRHLLQDETTMPLSERFEFEASKDHPRIDGSPLKANHH